MTYGMCPAAQAPMNAEPINLSLREHQARANGWNLRAVANDLHTWADRMNFEFKLQIPKPCLLIEPLRGRYGHFCHERNGFGLSDEIAIDEYHIRQSPYWRVLGTLLHESLHSWQQHYGKSGKHNYHNKEFRTKAASVGLIVDRRGCTDYAPAPSPFFDLLNRYGIEPPLILMSESRLVRHGSKLKLWECSCGVKVRVGRGHFNAQCLDCGGAFKLRPSLKVVPLGSNLIVASPVSSVGIRYA